MCFFYIKKGNYIMDNLYQNIGRKIKTIAIVNVILSTLFSVIFGFVYLALEHKIILATIIIILGPILSFISSFTLYGFGELIEKTKENADNTFRIIEILTSDSQYKTVQSNKCTTQDFINYPKTENIAKHSIEGQSQNNKKEKIIKGELKNKDTAEDVENDAETEANTVFKTLLNQLPDIKKDNKFVSKYSSNEAFLKMINEIPEVYLKLKFIELMYEYYISSMSEKEFRKRLNKLFAGTSYKP